MASSELEGVFLERSPHPSRDLLPYQVVLAPVAPLARARELRLLKRQLRRTLTLFSGSKKTLDRDGMGMEDVQKNRELGHGDHVSHHAEPQRFRFRMRPLNAKYKSSGHDQAV
jgi:hypothetical protein